MLIFKKLKNTCVMRNLHLCVSNNLHDQLVILKEDLFQHHRKKLLLVREKTRRLWVWRMKIFLMKINVNACTLENSSHIFSSDNGSIMVFQKMINKYNKTFNRKIYTLNSENVALNFVRLPGYFLPANFCFNEWGKFSTQST